MKRWYVSLFLLKVMLFATILVLKAYLSFGYELYVVIGIWLLPAFLVIVYRPYENTFDNLTLIIYDLTALTSLLMALGNNLIEIEPEN